MLYSKADPDAGYLKTRLDDWMRAHFDPRGHKAKRRRYFVAPAT